jgi:hypothetical protein
MTYMTQRELVLWAVLLIVQGLACAGLVLGAYLWTQQPMTTIDSAKARTSTEHLTKLKNPQEQLDRARLNNLVDYCVGLEKMIDGHQRVAAEIVGQARKLVLFFIAVLVISVAVEVAIILQGRRREARGTASGET